MSYRKTVGIFGATGYTGRELVKLVSNHPSLEVAFATGSGLLPHEEGLSREADAYLLALPHGVSAVYAASLRHRFQTSVVIDLSGDLRLGTAEAYRHWYGQEHPAPELLGAVPYGLPEVYREELRGARLIANPGCYATSVLLALVPLLRDRLVDADDIVVDAKSGASGAGRSPREELLFCEVSDDFSAYAPGRVHRHVGEMERVLGQQAGREVALTFCPHLLPVKRGILSAVYLRARASAGDVADALRTYYASSPFVTVVETPPRLSDVAYTNDCRLNVQSGASGRLIVFSALDNLLKGAAGQALQNLNLALGRPEAEGLPIQAPAAQAVIA